MTSTAWRRRGPDEAVRLGLLDEEVLVALVETAVRDADPGDVMPPVAGPPGWTPDRRRAFVQFLREHSLAEMRRGAGTAYVVVVGDVVAGFARLTGVDGGRDREIGMWLGRTWRGRGVGSVVVEHLLDEACGSGARRLVARTTASNSGAQRLLLQIGAQLTTEADGSVSAVLDLDRVRGEERRSRPT